MTLSAAELERLREPNPDVDGLVSPCVRCGRHPVRLDYLVSDEFWSIVVPADWRRKVVCFDCLDEMAPGGVPLDEVTIVYLTSGAGTKAFVAPLARAREGTE